MKYLFLIFFSTNSFGDEIKSYLNLFIKDLNESKTTNIIIDENLKRLDIELISIKDEKNIILKQIISNDDAIGLCNYDLTMIFINQDKYERLSNIQKKKVIVIIMQNP